MHELSSTCLRIERIIGKGGYASVYRCSILGAAEPELPRTVALKVLSQKYDLPDDLHRKLFLKEAETLATCQHPNILRCYGIVHLPHAFPGLQEGDGRVGMVLEYTQAGSLFECIKVAQASLKTGSRPPYSTLQALQWLLQLASALDYLHTQQPLIIHRDVKAENVLLFPDTPPDSSDTHDRPTPSTQPLRTMLATGTWIIKLADFGLHQTIADDQPVYLRRRHCSKADVVQSPSSDPTWPRAPSATQGLASDSVMAHQGSTPFRETDLFYTLDSQGIARSTGSFLSPVNVAKEVSNTLQRAATTGCTPSDSSRDRSPLRAPRTAREGARHGSPLRAPRVPGAANNSSSQPGSPLVRITRPDNEPAASPHDASPRGGAQEPVAQMLVPTASGSPKVVKSTSFRAPATLNAMSGHIRTAAHRRRSLEESGGDSDPLTSPRAGSILGSVYDDLQNTRSLSPKRNHQIHVLADRSHRARSQTSLVEVSSSRLSVRNGAGFHSDHPLLASNGASQGSGLPHAVSTGVGSVDGGGEGALPGSRLASVSHRAAFTEEFQAVFALTGETGSALYMSPEVLKRQPYSASCDIFSFALLAWELLANRSLMTLLHELDLRTGRSFAVEVSEGYRPQQPRTCSDAAWHLLSLCWEADPVARPTAHQVKAELQRIVNHMEKTKADVAAAVAADGRSSKTQAQAAGAGHSSQKGCCVLS